MNDDCMMLDCFNIIYLWIGNRSNEWEKKGIFKTADEYLEKLNDGRDKEAVSFVEVYAGKESDEFKSQFVGWSAEIAQDWVNADPIKKLSTMMGLQIEEKKEEVKAEEERYEKPGQKFYTLEELQGKFPEEVEPSKKEQYLNDADF